MLAAGLRDWVDFGVICALLAVNAIVGFVQEYQAGSIVEELKKTLALKASVIRNGEQVEIDASEVVPGDILRIDEVFHNQPSILIMLTHARAPFFRLMVELSAKARFYKLINLLLLASLWLLTSIMVIFAMRRLR